MHLRLDVQRLAQLAIPTGFVANGAVEVREIYSSMFLYPRLVLNDIEIPLMEEGRSQLTPVTAGLRAPSSRGPPPRRT